MLKQKISLSANSIPIMISIPLKL